MNYKIYTQTNQLPNNWDDIAQTNIFLTSTYFKVLENSAPKNMTCFFIGIFKNKALEGVAIAQLLNVTQVASFGVNKSCLQSKIRDLVFKNFAANVLFVGNNMLTGQNAFVFSKNITTTEGITYLKEGIIELKKQLKTQEKKVHITSFKDFEITEKVNFQINSFSKYYQFSTQPNMIFHNQPNWETENDYVNALSKKYRDHYKRARKKAEMVTKKQMNLDEILQNESKINELYFNVTKNAPFNTFYLAVNHFSELKNQLQNNFLFYGYFIENELIGFNTMIKNGYSLDTYFLGYSEAHQKDKMLYLNMLYDMIGYSITKKYYKLIFSRTALEIKSSVGAQPIEMIGYIIHSNRILNKCLPKLFPYFDPKVIWIERNPFK